MSSALMKMMAQAMNEQDEKKPLPTVEGQRLLLDEFLGAHTQAAAALKAGDEVVLNAHGKLRYRFPRDGQVARVSRVFDRFVLDNDGQYVSGEIVVVSDHGLVYPHAVDFRYLQPADNQ